MAFDHRAVAVRHFARDVERLVLRDVRGVAGAENVVLVPVVDAHAADYELIVGRAALDQQLLRRIAVGVCDPVVPDDRARRRRDVRVVQIDAAVECVYARIRVERRVDHDQLRRAAAACDGAVAVIDRGVAFGESQTHVAVHKHALIERQVAVAGDLRICVEAEGILPRGAERRRLPDGDGQVVDAAVVDEIFVFRLRGEVVRAAQKKERLEARLVSKHAVAENVARVLLRDGHAADGQSVVRRACGRKEGGQNAQYQCKRQQQREQGFDPLHMIVLLFFIVFHLLL